eukprot:scpid100434/ scgid18915/ 
MLFPAAPCGQDVQCQPLIDPHSDACHQMSTPGDLGNLENVLCAADYVLIVRLPFLYTQAQAEKIKRERGFRIVSEPIFPMRNKSQHTTTRSRIYFNSNTEYCPKVIEQLRYDSSMPSNRKFLVVGQRNRHYPSRIVIGTVDNTSRYHHGLLLIYDEFERYFEEILRRSVINSSLLGANTITDFKSYAGSLRCLEVFLLSPLFRDEEAEFWLQKKEEEKGSLPNAFGVPSRGPYAILLIKPS